MDKEIDSLLPPKYRKKKKPATNTDYWKDRQAQAQAKLTKRNAKEAEAQMRKYYEKALKHCTDEFEFTYMKLLNTKNGIPATPADLYKLDRYWQMQAEISKTLTKLGDKQAAFLETIFERHYSEIYYSIRLDGTDLSAFKHIDKGTAEQLMRQIWCADGESCWSRIWKNTEKLQQMLNDGLITCVTTGANPEDLKRELVKAFDVSYARADSLVKTEMAHIQTQAAADRYRDAGIEWYQVWADEDERRCDVCGKLHQKKYPMGENPPIPAHPNCRCTIIPIVE